VIGTDLDDLVGEKIWLEYFDQNYRFGKAFTSQYCTVARRYSDIRGANDWYLVRLETQVEYEGVRYTHLLIRSRWVDHPIGADEATAVLIVLVPDPNILNDPFEMNRSLYIAWGFAANDPGDIRR